ncbi:glycosyltransferase family 2 protein [Caulobacter soli]|uniref:glycosyltransferase family 2 protein n=1 Tax=Caulobacter soli TaxID=2708539 RepID=UPI001FE54114|nr:glycosyltransferase [Caulobacter soli]
MAPLKIAVILTCFNRKAHTLSAMRGIRESAHGFDVKVTLVDDGSRDGTREAVQDQYPEVNVVVGSGDLYWNGGMRRAWQEALDPSVDFYLWLNDDLELAPNFIRTAVDEYTHATEQYGQNVIIVGKVVHPKTGEVTYGGYRKRGGLSQLSFELLGNSKDVADTVNGNCVLIPSSAVTHIGINSDKYRHAFGDIDYGLRARRAGYNIIQTKDPVGYQEFNLSYMDSISVLTMKNWRYILISPKGVPFREWFEFCKDHGGPIWPVNFAFRYIKMIASGLQRAKEPLQGRN